MTPLLARLIKTHYTAPAPAPAQGCPEMLRQLHSLCSLIVCSSPCLVAKGCSPLAPSVAWPMHKLEFHISLIKIVCARQINEYTEHLFQFESHSLSHTTGRRLPKIMQHNIIVTLINDLQNHKSNTGFPCQWFRITKTGNSSAKRLNYNKTKCPGTWNVVVAGLASIVMQQQRREVWVWGASAKCEAAIIMLINWHQREVEADGGESEWA